MRPKNWSNSPLPMSKTNRRHEDEKSFTGAKAFCKQQIMIPQTVVVVINHEMCRVLITINSQLTKAISEHENWPKKLPWTLARCWWWSSMFESELTEQGSDWCYICAKWARLSLLQRWTHSNHVVRCSNYWLSTISCWKATINLNEWSNDWAIKNIENLTGSLPHVTLRQRS